MRIYKDKYRSDSIKTDSRCCLYLCCINKMYVLLLLVAIETAFKLTSLRVGESKTYYSRKTQ